MGKKFGVGSVVKMAELPHADYVGGSEVCKSLLERTGYKGEPLKHVGAWNEYMDRNREQARREISGKVCQYPKRHKCGECKLSSGVHVKITDIKHIQL